MAYNWLNVASPYFWLLPCGLFVGGSISRATRPVVRADRWSFVYLLLAVGVAAAACAFVVPNLVAARRIAVEPRIVVYTAVFAAAGYLGARFKLAAGIPLVVAAALWVIAAGASTRGFNPAAADEAVIGKLRVLSVGAHSLHLEIDVPPAPPEVRVMAADGFAPVARVVRFDDAYFFLSSSYFYRLDAIRAFAGGAGAWNRAPENDVAEAAPKPLLPIALPAFPGETRATLEVDPISPVPMASYAITLSLPAGAAGPGVPSGVGAVGARTILRLTTAEDAPNP